METTASTSALQYRLFREDDIPALVNLWAEESEWGTPTIEQWRGWYIDLPYEPSIIVVAVDEADNIAGQIILIPTRAFVDGREVGAVRGSTAIMRKQFRRSSRKSARAAAPEQQPSNPFGISIDDPMLRLYMLGMEEANRRNYSFFYSLPFHRLIPKDLRPEEQSHVVDGREVVQGLESLERTPHQDGKFFLGEYRCVEKLLQSVDFGSTYQSETAVREADGFGSEYDDLWEDAVRSFPISAGVIRRQQWLRFKNSDRLVLECRDGDRNALAGYAVIRRDTEQLVDLLTREPGLIAPVLRSALWWLSSAQRTDGEGMVDRLKVMETPLLAPALREIGFVPIDYMFYFICGSLDPTVPLPAISPPSWYLMPGD